MDFDTEGSDILLLELPSQVALDESSLYELLVLVRCESERSCSSMAGQQHRAGTVLATGCKECGAYLSGSSITNKHKLEGWDASFCHIDDEIFC
jgi:hypothetical protein